MTSPIRRVRLAMYGPLFAVYWHDHPGFELYLAGFITEANRDRYLAQHPGWTVVQQGKDDEASENR